MLFKFFFSDFLGTRVLRNVTRWLLPIHVNYEIRKTSRKPSNNKSSLPQVFCKKGIPKDFAKFTGNFHRRQSFFFSEVAK